MYIIVCSSDIPAIIKYRHFIKCTYSSELSVDSDAHIDDTVSMFAFCFPLQAGVGTGCCRDWLLQ